MKGSPFVFDTNTLISAALIKNSVSSQALDKAISLGVLIFLNETFEEFIEVIFRPKFDKYFLDDLEKYTFIETIQSHSSYLNPTSQIKACRDKKDNKFLELALDGKASHIITGDQDLLILHPFQEIPILAPQDFLSTFP